MCSLSTTSLDTCAAPNGTNCFHMVWLETNALLVPYMPTSFESYFCQFLWAVRSEKDQRELYVVCVWPALRIRDDARICAGSRSFDALMTCFLWKRSRRMGGPCSSPLLDSEGGYKPRLSSSLFSLHSLLSLAWTRKHNTAVNMWVTKIKFTSV